MNTKMNRIEERKREVGSRRMRKIGKFSNSFNEMFTFLFLLNRKDLIDFCGSKHNVVFDVNGDDGKFVFRKYENGFFNMGQPIITRHPNIVNSILIGKKGWGLWRQMWSEGIGEGSFTKYEILEEFKTRQINIPESIMTEFENNIWKERKKRGI